MTLGEFCKAMVNKSAVIKLYMRCNSDGEFGGYMCDTNKDTCLVEMYANKEIRAFKIVSCPTTIIVCIALKIG
jgi:hypothetical protein